MAIGMLVVPTLNWLMKGTTPGTRYPAPTPMAMAMKIQSVRARSRKDRRLATPFVPTEAPEIAVGFPLIGLLLPDVL